MENTWHLPLARRATASHGNNRVLFFLTSSAWRKLWTSCASGNKRAKAWLSHYQYLFQPTSSLSLSQYQPTRTRHYLWKKDLCLFFVIFIDPHPAAIENKQTCSFTVILIDHPWTIHWGGKKGLFLPRFLFISYGTFTHRIALIFSSQCCIFHAARGHRYYDRSNVFFKGIIMGEEERYDVHALSSCAFLTVFISPKLL